MADLRSWRIDLRYPKPPLSMNVRLHWRENATVVKEIRTRAKLLTHRRLPPMARIRVRLEWVVPDKIRRDADNPVPTLKAVCDGLVDAGLVPDDTPEYMVKETTEIIYRKGERGLFLIIEELAA